YGANKLTQHRGLAPDAELVAVSADLGRAFALSHVRLSGSFKSNSRPTARALLKSGFSFWLTSRSIGHRTGLICPPSRNGVCMREAGDPTTQRNASMEVRKAQWAHALGDLMRAGLSDGRRPRRRYGHVVQRRPPPCVRSPLPALLPAPCQGARSRRAVEAHIPSRVEPSLPRVVHATPR